MDLKKLNPMQRKAAETLEGPLLIIAGAGSGKTRTMTFRIANLMAHGVPPRSIMALTFTNKAAREMLERVAELVGEDAQQAWIGTFHSICVRILRRDIEKLGYQRSFVIYDEDDQQRILRDIYKQLDQDEKQLPVREMRAIISDAKNRLLTADEWFKESHKDFRSQRIHDIFTMYDQRLRKANALDFDDIISHTLQLLVDHPPVMQYYRDRFKYVHVDEYQDTNFAQYSLVRLFTEESRNLCVVGDDDQSIYGWRGADVRNILEFKKDFPDAVVIKLEQNYRSTSTILDASNQLIANNTGRMDKKLWTEDEEGEPIRFYDAVDERGEGAWVCERIRRLRKLEKVQYSEMAVL
ncbi:MAG: UvrD-helicase domain-containing protein, partial [Clostridiales bacterium]|nr:UvrD-helicase domain-containing protein [Clostridiales bacterium]